MRDDDVRSSCFASFDVLCAKHGGEVPYTTGLDEGFPFRGRRVPFLSRYKGIHRAAAQRDAAALSINTSHASPYEDQETPDETLYAYRAGSPDQPDNRALRVSVARGLLEDEDGPMLELLKRFDGQEILVPASVRARPDRDRLASRFERFRDRAS